MSTAAGADASASEVDLFGCPTCGAAVAVRRWYLVDGGRRPDLLESLVDGTLNRLVCTACGASGDVDTALLVWLPDRTPALVYMPSNAASESFELAQAEAAELVDQLRVRTGGDPRLQEVSGALPVGPSSLARVLTRDVLVDAAAYEQGDLSLASDDPYSGVLATVLRQLRSDAVDRCIDARTWGELRRAVAERPPSAASDIREELLRRLGSVDKEADEVAFRTVEEITDALALLAASGDRDVPDAAPLGPVNALFAVDHLRASGEYDAAVAMLEGALAELEEGTEPWIRVTNDLGVTLAERRTGDIAEDMESAIGCYFRALEHCSRNERADAWATVQRNLGIAYRRRVRGARAENVELAIRHQRHAAEAFDQLGDAFAAAQVRINLATAYLLREYGTEEANCAEAMALLRRSIAIVEAEGTAEDKAIARLTLGNALRAGGDSKDLTEAMESFTASAAHYRDAGRTWKAASAELNLGLAYRDRVDGDRSADLAEALRLLRTASEALPEDAMPFEWAAAHYNLAVTLAESAGTEGLAAVIKQIEDHVHASLRVYRPDSHPVQAADAAQMLGRGLGDVGDWRGAADEYRIALLAAERLYEAAVLGAARDVEIRDRGFLHHEAAYALARAGEAEEAVRAVEGGRALWLGQSVGAARVRDELAERLSSDDRDALDDALWRLQDMVSKERDYGTFSDEMTRAALRDGLHTRAHQALEDVTKIAARYGLAEDTVDAAAVRRALRADEGFAYVVVTEWGSLALLVDADAVTPLWCDGLASATLVELLTRRDEDGVAYITALFDGGERLAEHLDHVLHGVGPALVAPLASQARAAGLVRLTLVPTGLLGLVPLHAARYPGQDGETDLLMEFAVAYAPSGLTWRAARERAARPAREPRLAAVANPLPTDEPLTFAVAEAEEIRRLFRFGRVLKEDEATKEAVLAAATDATHVHLGCHARYDVEFPLASQIELATREILTLQELVQRTSFGGVRVVVAAACQSGMAGLDKTPDEALGFPAGFLSAGASAVVAALWPVHDLTAALISVRIFADILAGASPAEALAAAQHWLRTATAGQIAAYIAERPALAGAARAWLARTRRAPDAVPFSSPIYWAPYLVVGA